MFFVFRILHKISDDSWIIDGTTHGTEVEAKHHYHQVLTTYAYGNNSGYDYVACQVQTFGGGMIVGEVDDRRPETEAE